MLFINQQLYRKDDQLIQNQHSPPLIKILLYNMLERTAKTYAEVMAIEKFLIRMPELQQLEQIKKLNKNLIVKEQQQQNQFIQELEQKYNNTEKQVEFKEAKQQYQDIQISLQQMLSNDNQMLIQSQMLSKENEQIVDDQSINNLLDILKKFYFSSQINFHNLLVDDQKEQQSLKNDQKGQQLQQSMNYDQKKEQLQQSMNYDQKQQQLQQCMKDYSQKLSQYLYFLLVKEQDPDLKLLLSFILIARTQNNVEMLKILNNYIQSLIQVQQQNVIIGLNQIINIFPEFRDLFQKIIRAITQRTNLDGNVEMDEKQFEIILLILDVSKPKCISFVQAISEESSNILRQISLIYKSGCSKEFLISQQKRLTNLLSIQFNYEIIKDLTQLLDQLQSVKLKLLIERIIEFHKKMEEDICLEYLEFNVFLPQDQEALNKHTQFANQLRNNQMQPQIQIQQQLQNNKLQGAQLQILRPPTNSKAIQYIYQFLNILSIASKLDCNKIHERQYDELSKLVSDEIAGFHTSYDPNLFVTRQKIRDTLVSLLQLQKLELNSFQSLWYLSEQLKLYLEKAAKDNQTSNLSKQSFPFLNQILSTYKKPIKESFQFTQLKTQILKEPFWITKENYHVDFHNLMKLIESYNGTNQQDFLQSVSMYYKKEFKQYLEKLKEEGSDQVKNAINLVIQTQ